jgi:hypothetical protein
MNATNTINAINSTNAINATNAMNAINPTNAINATDETDVPTSAFRTISPSHRVFEKNLDFYLWKNK